MLRRRPPGQAEASCDWAEALAQYPAAGHESKVKKRMMFRKHETEYVDDAADDAVDDSAAAMKQTNGHSPGHCQRLTLKR